MDEVVVEGVKIKFSTGFPSDRAESVKRAVLALAASEVGRAFLSKLPRVIEPDSKLSGVIS